MASITAITGLPKYFIFGEQFESISVTIKMGSAETITSSSTSVCEVAFLLGNYSSTSEIISRFGSMDNAMSNSIIGSRSLASTTSNAYFYKPVVSNGSGFTIAKSGSKKFTLANEGSIGFTQVYGLCTPYTGDYTGNNNVLGGNTKIYTNFVTQSNSVSSSSILDSINYLYYVTAVVKVSDSSHSGYYAILNTMCAVKFGGWDKPTATITMSDYDSRNALNVFGNYVRLISKPRVTVNFVVDQYVEKLYDGNNYTKHTISIKDPNGNYVLGTTVSIEGSVNEQVKYTGLGTKTVSFDFIEIEGTAQGSYRVDYDIEDNKGNHIYANKTFTIKSYEYPYVVKKSSDVEFLQRYSGVQNEDGTWQYDYDELGEKLRINGSIVVSSVSGNSKTNSWTASVVDMSTNRRYQIASKSNGETVSFTNNMSLLNSLNCSAGEVHEYNIVVVDQFGEYIVEKVTINKGEGYFDIEKTGVAVGMLSTSTETNKKFECKYPAYFYGGIALGGSGGIDGGHVAGEGNVSSSSYKDFNVTFNKTFDSPPIVVVGFQSGSTAGTFGRCCCSATNITETGFTLRFFNGDSTARNPAFNWIAFGD